MRKIPRKDSYAIRVVGSANSKGAEADGWKLILTDGPGKGVIFQFGKDGRFRILSKSGGDPRTFPPIAHPAIKPEPNQNELLVIYRSPRLEIYVNGVAICSPIDWESNLKRAYFSIGISGTSGGHAEYDSLTVWETAEIPTLEQRIAKASAPSPVTNVPPAVPTTPAAPTPTPVEPAELKDLRTRTTAASGKAAGDRIVVALRQELSDFRLKHYGTPVAAGAAQLMSQLRWPVDDFKQDTIDRYELKVAGGSDATQAPPHLVQIAGDTKFKHWNTIHSLSFSPNGRYLASASFDRTAIIWDAIKGEAIHTLTGFPDWVVDAEFSPDGRDLATCFLSTEGKSAVQIWNVQTGKLVRTLAGEHLNAIRRVAWSRDGRKMVSTDYFHGNTPKSSAGKHRIVIWDAVQGKPLKTIEQSAGILAIAMHPRNDWFATAGYSKQIDFWDLKSGDPLPGESLKGHEAQIYDLSFSHDGKLLASASQDKSVKIWNADSRSVLHTGTGHEATVTCVRFSRTDSELISAGHDGTVKAWIPQQDKTLKAANVIHNSDNTVHFEALAINPQNGLLAMAGNDSAIRFRDSANNAAKFVNPGHNVRVLMARQSLDGKVIGTIDRQGDICTWSVNEAKLVTRIPGYVSSLTPREIALNPTGQVVADARVWRSTPVKFFSTSDGKEVSPPFKDFYGIRCAISPDGQLIAVGTREPDRVLIRNLQSGKELASIDQPKEPVLLKFSPDSSMLATSEYGYKGFRLWNAQTGAVLGTHTAHASGIEWFDWSPDGKLMVTSDLQNGGQLKVWDMESKKVLAELITPSMKSVADTARVCHFSPDGRLISALVKDTGVIHFWATNGLKPLGTMQVLSPSVNAGINHQFFSPDGRHIVTVNPNGTLYYHRIPPEILSAVK